MTFDAAVCAVRPVHYRQAKAVIAENHYIGRMGSTSFSLGLFIAEKLAGVVCYGTIPRNNASAVCGPDNAGRVLELTRLALYDWAPRNSESFIIGRSFSWITKNRPGVGILISYADASVGHVGTIYQATNWLYTGKSGGDVFWQCDDGAVIHTRSLKSYSPADLPPGRFLPSAGKHRYINFLGPPGQRRKLRKQLRWQPLPYPKHEKEVTR